MIAGRQLERRRLAVIVAALVALGGLAAPASAAGDVTPPVGTMEYWAMDNVTQLAELRFAYTDPESGLDHIKFRCDGGPDHIVPYATKVFLPIHDGSAGCSTTYGNHEVMAWVVNRDGLESLDQYAPVSNGPAMSVTVSAAPTTGQAVTITPILPSDYVIPAGSFCRWEFRWGTTAALDTTFTGDTFGGLLFDVSSAGGGCGPWTFTLPWVPFRQYDVIVELGRAEPDGGMSFGARAHDRFMATVGSPERRILSSSLPIAQVLPSTYTPIVGQPITYTRYLVGGATTCCNARWVARLGDGENPKQWTQSGGSTFTFTPSGPGDLFVGWDRQAASGLLLSGYYDPPVRDRDTAAPVTSAPIQQLGTASVASTNVRLAIKWSGSDKGWGIRSYQLQRSLNGGAWAGVALPSPTSTVVGLDSKPGSTLRFRVRAIDKAGLVGAWTYGPTFRVVLGSDANTAVKYSGTWTTAASAAALGGSSHRTSSRGAAASYTFSGRDFSWVSAKGPNEGKAAIYVNGVFRATIDLYSATSMPRRIAYRMHWSTVASRTIRIVNLGTSGRPLIDIDGLAILR
ncbi:MAG TPA: fibronectin type III domain-containing protein [Patescibacteria group bacterium]|nr:fibronectin type III domain-containing protein [Patescibacteria group bacterium]